MKAKVLLKVIEVYAQNAAIYANIGDIELLKFCLDEISLIAEELRQELCDE